jgi:hypothetical protein
MWYFTSPGQSAARGPVGELAEDLRGALAHHVGEHVQSAAMGHRDDDLVDAVVFTRRFEGQVEQRDQALAAFEREALGADELLVEELLEDLRVGELGQDPELLLAGERDLISGLLHRVWSHVLISMSSMCMNCTPSEPQ